MAIGLIIEFLWAGKVVQKDLDVADNMITAQVAPDDDKIRLDRLVAQTADVSRTVARRLIGSGLVRVGRRVVKIYARSIAAGSRVSICMDEASTSNGPAAPPFSILHIDPHIVVINKQSGLLSESDAFGSPSVPTLLGKWLRHNNEQDNIFLVHRLDAVTSGVMVVARKKSAARRLDQAFRERTVEKTYAALCTGFIDKSVVVDAPIARIAGVRHGVVMEGKVSQTKIIPIERIGGDATQVECRPKTGRTHQIRVHLAHLGHPILGDHLYGGPRFLPCTQSAASSTPIARVMLHASRLEFVHPLTDKKIAYVAALPRDFKALSLLLRQQPSV